MKSSYLVFLFLCSSFAVAAVPTLQTRHVYCVKGDSACGPGRFNFGVGVGWSRYSETSVFLPQLELQMALTNNFALGIHGGGINAGSVYKNADVPSLVFGGGLNYYSKENYHGFWFQIGAAEYLYKRPEGNSRYTSYAAALSTIGWRWHPDDVSGSFGLAAGVQRLFRSGAYLQPLFRMDAAVDFNLDSIFY